MGFRLPVVRRRDGDEHAGQAMVLDGRVSRRRLCRHDWWYDRRRVHQPQHPERQLRFAWCSREHIRVLARTGRQAVPQVPVQDLGSQHVPAYVPDAIRQDVCAGKLFHECVTSPGEIKPTLNLAYSALGL
jgi:hypothetical protein